MSIQEFQSELKMYRKQVEPSSNVTTFYSVPHESRQWLTARVLELTQLYELLLSIVPQRIEVLIMQKANTQAVSPSSDVDATQSPLGLIYFFCQTIIIHFELKL